MTVPSELRKRIDAVLDTLSNESPLRPDQLADLHNAFGLPIDPAANRARGRLVILTAERVLPHWQAIFPEEKTPDRVLALARELLDGRTDLDAAFDYADHARFAVGYAVDNMDLDRGEYDFQADFAGQTALKALEYVLYLQCFTRKIPLHGYHELEPTDLLDPWTAAIQTALQAQAGLERDEYGEWSGKFDPGRCREFWQWWLSEAIPAAWNA